VLPFLVAQTFAATPWQKPNEQILSVLNAPEIPTAWSSPDGQHLLLVTPIRYPPLSDLAAPMHALAGMRINPQTGGLHRSQLYTQPTLLSVADSSKLEVKLPDDVRILNAIWSADSDKLAIIGERSDRIGLWVAHTDGKVVPVDLALAPVLDGAVSWMPDQEHLLVKHFPAGRGAAPKPPAVPSGPTVREGNGDSASSTYEARDLITSPQDEALFAHFTTSQLAVVDAGSGKAQPVGAPGVYSEVSASPNGKYLLVHRLQGPWSYRVAWWRFATDIEIWTLEGELAHKVASLPVAEEVPIHGVPTGARDVGWRQNAPATLTWIEALDGGNPTAKVPHRDQVMQLAAPWGRPATLLAKVPHRVESLSYGERGLVLVSQFERERRWRHVWTVNAEKGASTARPWFDLSANDRYQDPGSPMTSQNSNGAWLIEQDGDWIWFRGEGASPTGDRPFLDKRSLTSGRTERVFRSGSEVFERFVRWVDRKKGTFLVYREAPEIVPNIHLATLGAKVPGAAAGEAVLARTDRPVTTFEDPTPILRGVTKQIVTYQRKDGVPLSFTLYLPPGYKPGTPLPTVINAYPREFSDPATAGQVSGSERTFNRFIGANHLFFVLEGYAVLHNTTMPVLGDPETAYDTFVEQLVSSAEAALDKAVEMGVADPTRVGLIGHSHGGLMVSTLLAHSDRFRAGIARSGAYNHTIRPFGFQSERRTLWEAKDTYVGLSPVMFAPQIREPLLLVHGAIDENPGTVPLQSERLFEAVRGTGGTVRLVMLPFEGHGYAARESVEHVLWEQLSWFDRHVKNATIAGAASVGAGP
jgi:dipeptidyl aminopeptidase/acylaminoacyl peptidase